MSCKTCFFVGALVCLATNVFAFQYQDEKLGKVKLKDGTVYKSQILAIDGSKNVTMSLPENKNFTVPSDLIFKIKAPGIRYYGSIKPTKGFTGSVSFGLLFGKSSDFSGMRGGVSLVGVFGYQFTDLLGVGIGGGAEFINDLVTAPLFVRFDGVMLRTRVTPIYNVDLGGSFAWYNDNGFNQFNDVKGGWLVRPGLGVKFQNLNNSLYFLISYQVQRLQYETTSRWQSDFQSIELRTMKNLKYTFGIKF